MTGPGGAAPSFADRLAHVRVELRPDLDISRHVFRRKAAYVLRDPLTFQSTRFSASDYRVLVALTTSETLGQTFERLVEAGDLAEEDRERFFQFVFSLHKSGFLKLPISDDGSLYKRYESRRKAKRAQAFQSALFCRVPLWNPDAFLERTVDRVRWVFGRGAIAAWVMWVALAAWLVWVNWAEFSRPVVDIFSGGNLPFLWVTLIVLKVAHEFGHAYACKHFGGHVPEMGAYLIVLTPCAYVDASSSWGFQRKRDRIFVCMAGMYVEIAIAALAVVLWSVAPPGATQALLHNVVVLASVVTVGFNVNPLMRYDGYYALSDVLEIPNLRQRAQDEGIGLLKSLVLGIRRERSDEGPGYRVFLTAFAACGAVYKVLLVLGISAMIATKFLIVGLAMGGFYVASEVARLARRLFPYLWRAEETAPVRRRAMALAVAIAVGLPFAALSVPIPRDATAPGWVSSESELVLRAQAPGFVEALAVVPGMEVDAGGLVARLGEPEAVARLAEVRARVEAARVRARAAATSDPGSADILRERVRQLEREEGRLEAELESLELRAPERGVVVSVLEQSEVGRYVERGEVVATLRRGRTSVRALFPEEVIAMADLEVGDEVVFEPHASHAPMIGRVRRISAHGVREIGATMRERVDPTELAVNPATGETDRNRFEVDVVLDEGVRDLDGLRGDLVVSVASEPLARTCRRKFLQFLSRLGG